MSSNEQHDPKKLRASLKHPIIDADGHDVTDGFVLREHDTAAIEAMAITRDAAGLCAGVALKQADGSTLELRSGGRRAGFWVPMGEERDGPAMLAPPARQPATSLHWSTTRGTT